MGKRRDVSNATSYVDQYRKQLGRQETKRVKIRFKAEKEGEAKKETVTKFKIYLAYIALILMILFGVYIAYNLLNKN